MTQRFSWTSDRIRETLEVSSTGKSARVYSGISTDTRTLNRGELFVALRGERFDGTEFVAAAVEAGAAGAIVERRPGSVPAELELFVVDDALWALGQLAAARRKALDPTVVAITGTSGKTTTRALLTALLGGAAYGSPGNYNNLVGVPLSILAAPERAKIWILELASNQPGEIERLGRIAEPDYAVITSASEGHLEGLGNLQGVLDEKLSLLSTVRPGGRALVADEPTELVLQARDRYPDVLTVGLGRDADERPDAWSATAEGVAWTWSGIDFELPGFGAHMVRNALLAIVAARLLGVDPQLATQRLSIAEIPPMRGEVRRLGDLTLLIDCYNANPASFRAAIESLAALAEGRRRAVLAGTMLELGAQSNLLHERVADGLVDAGIELIAAVGEFATAFRRSTHSRRGDLILEDELEDAYRELVTRLRGDEVVLLKASRGMKFERAIPLFERDFGGRERANVSGTEG
jgi:UDP-N-acetylmuramoyl-tripeptide--D-alanyl-D-alanine ligase